MIALLQPKLMSLRLQKAKKRSNMTAKDLEKIFLRLPIITIIKNHYSKDYIKPKNLL